jgi:tRNA(Ile)-lysidine synthase
MPKTVTESFNSLLPSLIQTHHIHSILLAVSGGSDSMALLHLFKQYRQNASLTLQVAHLNHQFRGEASDRDEALLKNCCTELQLPLHCIQVSPEEWDHVPGTGLEEKARNKRYEFFFHLMTTYHIDTLAVGHTQDDLLETMLFNLIRGTSPEKLAKLLPLFEPNRRILRPLLCFTKDMLKDYLDTHRLPYHIDESNLDCSFTRNLLRNSLIPLLKNINPQISSSLLRFKDILSLEQDCFSHSFFQLLKSPLWEVACDQDAEIRIRRPLYLELHKAYQYRLIRHARQVCVGHTRDFYYHTLLSICQGIHQSIQFRYNDTYWSIWTKKNWVYFKKNEKEKVQ